MQCQACGKLFQKLTIHLGRSKSCKLWYDRNRKTLDPKGHFTEIRGPEIMDHPDNPELPVKLSSWAEVLSALRQEQERIMTAIEVVKLYMKR